MRNLLSQEGEKALIAIMRRKPLLVFDFDGTLAPIVSEPDEAEVPTPLAHQLSRLGLFLPIGIITGRSVDDVTVRLGFSPHYVIGNHGAQDPSRLSPPGDASTLDYFRHRLTLRTEALRQADVWIEDKGYSLALHFRSARDHKSAQALILTLTQDLDPRLKCFGGKYVVNIVPADAPDKADALMSLVKRSRTSCAVFVGDDINDEPAFARAPKDWLTVRIGNDDPSSQASFFLDNHGEMTILLERMLALASSAT